MRKWVETLCFVAVTCVLLLLGRDVHNVAKCGAKCKAAKAKCVCCDECKCVTCKCQ